MSVEVTNETIWDIDAKAFSDLGLWVMDQMRVSTQSDLTILFVDPDPRGPSGGPATARPRWRACSATSSYAPGSRPSRRLRQVTAPCRR